MCWTVLAASCSAGFTLKEKAFLYITFLYHLNRILQIYIHVQYEVNQKMSSQRGETLTHQNCIYRFLINVSNSVRETRSTQREGDFQRHNARHSGTKCSAISGPPGGPTAPLRFSFSDSFLLAFCDCPSFTVSSSISGSPAGCIRLYICMRVCWYHPYDVYPGQQTTPRCRHDSTRLSVRY